MLQFGLVQSLRHMRIVGKRTPATGLAQMDALNRLVTALRVGKPFIPKGVHRFSTFEEAQAWSLKMMTRKNPGRQR